MGKYGLNVRFVEEKKATIFFLPFRLSEMLHRDDFIS